MISAPEELIDSTLLDGPSQLLINRRQQWSASMFHLDDRQDVPRHPAAVGKFQG